MSRMTSGLTRQERDRLKRFSIIYGATGELGVEEGVINLYRAVETVRVFAVRFPGAPQVKKILRLIVK